VSCEPYEDLERVKRRRQSVYSVQLEGGVPDKESLTSAMMAHRELIGYTGKVTVVMTWSEES
jgi:hypothetical protein